MKNKFDVSFWENKYTIKSTRWDVGYISTPLKTYFNQLEDKDISILIPGAGNGYEAEYLYELGFKNVFLLDFASQPLENFSARVPNFPKEHLIKDDFLIIMERTI